MTTLFYGVLRKNFDRQPRNYTLAHLFHFQGMRQPGNCIFIKYFRIQKGQEYEIKNMKEDIQGVQAHFEGFRWPQTKKWEKTDPL